MENPTSRQNDSWNPCFHPAANSEGAPGPLLVERLGLDGAENFLKNLPSLFEGNPPGATRIVPAGEGKPGPLFEVAWFGGADGGPAGFWVRDVTEREAERDRLALIEALVEHSWEGVSIFDASANILYEHSANRRFTGYEANEILGRNLFEFCHPEDAERLIPRFAKLAEAPGAAVSDIVRWRHKDGRWIYLEGTVVNQLHHPRLRGMINTFRDVTHRVEIERQLKAAHKEAEAMRELQSRFLANLAHELRTPLTLVKQPVEELTEDSVDLRADIARRNLRRLESLMEELHDLTRMDAGVFQVRARRCPIRALLEDWIKELEPLAMARSMRLELESGADEFVLFADARKLAKAVLNLLRNAIRFAPSGSVVRIRCHQIEGERGGGPGLLRLEVIDEGDPIPEAQRERIFERFFRIGQGEEAASLGMGLGLTIAREMVELHGGEIGYERHTDENCFWIRLPLDADHLAPHEIDTSPEATDGPPVPERLEILGDAPTDWPPNAAKIDPPDAREKGRPRILLVEDNADLRNYLAFHLESLYALDRARDGQDALEQALGDPPDLLLSDVMMPRLDGLELTARLRKHFSPEQLPILLLSAKGTHADRVGGLAAGANDYLAKPFSMQELLLRLHRLVSWRGGAVPAEATGWAGKVRAHIDKRLEDPGFGVIQLAEELGISLRTFQRRFAEDFGTRAVLYLQQRRLEHGRDLLKSGEVNTVAEAARRVGLTPSYFSRLFAAAYQTSPGHLLAKMPEP